MEGTPTLKALREGYYRIVEGVEVQLSPGEIKPGDFYVAERNGPPKLLLAREIKDGCVYPDGIAYPFYIHECVRVR